MPPQIDYNLLSEREQIQAVRHNTDILPLIDNPSYTVQLASVKHSGYAIKHIKNSTYDIQLVAVKSSAFAIRYIENPTEYLQFLALTHGAKVLKYIKNPSDTVQFRAICINILNIAVCTCTKDYFLDRAIIGLRNHTVEVEVNDYDLQMALIYKNPESFKYIANVYPELATLARMM